MSKEWKQWHIELNEAIEIPSKLQIAKMNEQQLELYETWKAIQDTKEKLSELEELFADYKNRLQMDDLPDWCWIWYKKHSRVSWKQEFIKQVGQTEANKLSAEAKQTKHPQIGIQFIDPDPKRIPENPEEKKRKQKPKRFVLQ